VIASRNTTKKAEPRTPHFLSLNQDIVAWSQNEKCRLKYVMFTQSKIPTELLATSAEFVMLGIRVLSILLSCLLSQFLSDSQIIVSADSRQHVFSDCFECIGLDNLRLLCSWLKRE